MGRCIHCGERTLTPSNAWIIKIKREKLNGPTRRIFTGAGWYNNNEDAALALSMDSRNESNVLVGGAKGPLGVIIAPKAVRKNNTLARMDIIYVCVYKKQRPAAREIILLNDLLRWLSRA